MLKAGSDISDLTPDQIVRNDLKEIEENGKVFSVSQVSVMDAGGLLAQKTQLLQALERMRTQSGYEASFLMITNIVEKTTRLLYRGDVDDIVRKAFKKEIDNSEVYLPNVMSRKSEIVPPLLSAMKERR